MKPIQLHLIVESTLESVATAVFIKVVPLWH